MNDADRPAGHAETKPLRRMMVTDAAIHVEAARPVHKGMLRGILILGVGTLGVGGYAIFKGTSGDTSFDLFGAHLKTTNVGVALVGIGALCCLFAYRRLLQSVEKLAALPDERR